MYVTVQQSHAFTNDRNCMVCFWHKMKGSCACSIRRAAVLRKIQFEVNYEYSVFSDSKERGSSHL